MNPSHNFTTAHAPSMSDIARSVVSGCASMLPRVDHELHTFSEWQDAAQCLLDGDPTDFICMMEDEADYQLFKEWERVDYERRQFADFKTWQADRRRWLAGVRDPKPGFVAAMSARVGGAA